MDWKVDLSLVTGTLARIEAHDAHLYTRTLVELAELPEFWTLSEEFGDGYRKTEIQGMLTAFTVREDVMTIEVEAIAFKE